jgi:acyl-CoA-dependent ceramide synthase
LHGPWHASQFATEGPFILDWATEQYKCWISQWVTFVLLAALQAVNLFWLFLIMRILWRMLRSSELADERSEYDSDEDEDRQTELADMKKEQGAVNGKTS